DAIAPVVRFDALHFEETKIEVGGRFEYVDYNATRFASTSVRAGDERTRVTAVAAWRLSASTVLRSNYAYDWVSDRLQSGVSRIAKVEVGLATYF
ncbi:MAG: hypothetical protein H7Z43_08020, partial [Clostridia bacterium]|nr:hypothetical protein [Deltaproteobacteria bacterium]